MNGKGIHCRDQERFSDQSQRQKGQIQIEKSGTVYKDPAGIMGESLLQILCIKECLSNFYK